MPYSTAPAVSGSSPHTRGARWHASNRPVMAGIIPAYAGSTACTATCARRLADHPRIRGEHADITERFPDHEGSSPHTRGAHGHPSRLGRRRRIIPAYAGSTATRSTATIFSSDHPRIRGEHASSK